MFGMSLSRHIFFSYAKLFMTGRQLSSQFVCHVLSTWGRWKCRTWKWRTKCRHENARQEHV